MKLSTTYKVANPIYSMCPVCNGTKVVDGHDCNNCGGQKMYSEPKGYVRLSTLSGNACVHDYVDFPALDDQPESVINKLCWKCGDTYTTYKEDIDAKDV